MLGSSVGDFEYVRGFLVCEPDVTFTLHLGQFYICWELTHTLYTR